MSPLLLGPGAEPDLNWELVQKDSIAEGNQATDLPERNPVALPTVSLSLDHNVRFHDSHAEVVKALRSYNLHRLIDSSIERRLRSDPNAEKWFRLSLQVGRWMMGSTQSIVAREFLLRGCDVEFADD